MDAHKGSCEEKGVFTLLACNDCCFNSISTHPISEQLVGNLVHRTHAMKERTQLISHPFFRNSIFLGVYMYIAS